MSRDDRPTVTQHREMFGGGTVADIGDQSRRVLPGSNKQAPRLMVMYRCPTCDKFDGAAGNNLHRPVLDAYEGPPVCLGVRGREDGHGRGVVMVGIELRGQE